MIAFDKLKLVSTLDSIEIVDPAKFDMIIKGGRTVSMTMSMKQPFYLDIEINYDKGEVIIEFTGKVLGERYPELINLNTVHACFQNINDLGFCEIDIDKMMYAQVVKCDVTKDVRIVDIPSLNRYIRGHIKNYQYFKCDLKRNGNLIIEKNVTGRRYKRRITLYDKEAEMMRTAGQEFTARYGLDGKYDGMCRFEMNLNSQQAIRDALDITGTTLSEVLNTGRNPIEDFLDEVIQEDTEASVQDTWKTYWQTLVLEDCGFDLAKVEAKIREYKGGGIAKAMRPFRELMEALPAGTSTWTKDKLLGVVR